MCPGPEDPGTKGVHTEAQRLSQALEHLGLSCLHLPNRSLAPPGVLKNQSRKIPEIVGSSGPFPAPVLQTSPESESCHTNSCSFCSPHSLGHRGGWRQGWFRWGHQKSFCSLLGHRLGPCHAHETGVGHHRFPVGHLAHPLSLPKACFNAPVLFLFIFPLLPWLSSSSPLLSSLFFLSSQHSITARTWRPGTAHRPSSFQAGSIVVGNLKAFSFKDELGRGLEECWEVMPVSSFFSFPPLGLRDQIFFFFFFTVHFGRPHFFSDRKKNNRHILGDYSTGVLCDRICSCVTNGAGFLLVSFPFQSSCLLPYTEKKKKKP